MSPPIKGIRIVTTIQVEDNVEEITTQMVTEGPSKRDIESVITGHCQTILNGLGLKVVDKTDKVVVRNSND